MVSKSLSRWPWLTLQMVTANVLVILTLAFVWYIAFVQQSNVYSDKLMATFNIEPGMLHAMYVEDVERQLWTSVLLGLILACAISVFLTLLIVKPLRALARVTERLGQGDYSVRSEIGHGEVGRLSHNFNSLATALAQEEQRRNQFMADLSHELRTPITSLRGYTEGLEDGIFKADEKFFRLMQTELEQLTALTGAIECMQLRPRTSSTGGNATGVGIQTFFEDAKINWETRFKQRQLTLQIVIARNLGNRQLAVSPNCMKQITDNLLSNMFRYASNIKSCRIDIARGKAPNFATFSFSNAAPDLNEAALPFLFDRFYRVSSSRTRIEEEHPSGLGLSIVKQLCLAYQGSASASLQRDRLTISVDLPLVS